MTAIRLHAKRKKLFDKYYEIIKKEAKVRCVLPAISAGSFELCLHLTYPFSSNSYQNSAPSFLGVLAERLLVDDEKRASTLVQEEYHRVQNARNELDRREAANA